MSPNTPVLATFLGAKVRGKIVGRVAESKILLVQVDAADILTLRGKGYPYHTIAVGDGAVKLR